MDQFGHQQTRIEPFGGDFSSKMQITLRADARGGEICYTTDGSHPKPDSAIYREPIVLDRTATVRAQTFKVTERF